MKLDEFISFEEKKPDKKKWIIVTNNLTALNAHGEMSHVWLTTFWKETNRGIVTFDGANKVQGLTHWKYA